jgi:hypothetical protein
VFALALAATLGLSAWRLEVHGISRTREDRVVQGVTRMRGVHAEAIVLADSVTAAPAYGATPAPGVYPMLMNGYLRLAGQYLLFRRFLEHNTTRRMFLFAHPNLFIQDVSDVEGGGFARYTYIDSVFTRRDEERILDAAGAHPAHPVEPRFERLLKTWSANHFPQPYSVDLFTVAPSLEPVRADPAPREVAPLTPQVRYILERFQRTCLEHDVECTIVEEPTRAGATRYDMAELGRRFPGLRFVDMNDFVLFPASTFHDGMHLDRATGHRYLREIQAHIAPLFAASAASWDGNKIEFSRPETLSMFASDKYHDAEGWGAWTSAATLAMRFRVSEDLRGGELRLGVRTPPQPGNAPVPVSFWLDGKKMAEIASPDPQPREVVFPLTGLDLAAGSTHTLELRMPHVVNLRALGMSGDPRDLGPGIVSIAWCGPGRCGWPR